MNDESDPSRDIKAPVSRENLYQEVWAEPMTTVAARYKVSSSFLARVCTWLNVPRPQRGYWAKLAVGKMTKRPPLPEANPGDELEWSRYGQARRAKLPLPKPPQRKKAKHCNRSELPEIHPHLQGAKQLFDEGRETSSGYLKPIKRLLVDVIVSKQTCNRALDVANELFLLFEERGYQVAFAPKGVYLRRYAVDEREKGGRERNFSDLWYPARDTIVSIGTVLIGLTIFEMSENVEVKYQDGKYTRVSDLPAKKPKRYESYSWISMQDLPSGRLCVQAYSPYNTATWSRQWKETKAGDFPSKLSAIVKELKREAATIAQLVEEGERQAEIERQRREAEHLVWLREEEVRRRIRAEKESREELFKVIESWAEVKKIEEFFADAERRAAGLSEDEKENILERLKLARKMVGGVDALQRFRSWKAPDER
jgi:hypothetical protein